MSVNIYDKSTDTLNMTAGRVADAYTKAETDAKFGLKSAVDNHDISLNMLTIDMFEKGHWYGSGGGAVVEQSSRTKQSYIFHKGNYHIDNPAGKGIILIPVKWDEDKIVHVTTTKDFELTEDYRLYVDYPLSDWEEYLKDIRMYQTNALMSISDEMFALHQTLNYTSEVLKGLQNGVSVSNADLTKAYSNGMICTITAILQTGSSGLSAESTIIQLPQALFPKTQQFVINVADSNQLLEIGPTGIIKAKYNIGANTRIRFSATYLVNK